ncbi:MAG: response regulator transcription factor [Gammaproteobacteria bacterium]|nr:response regulator transcription factor [Gammaproteobacteria bacterium]
MRIALLEDDPDQAQLTELWLSQAGHQTLVFNNGRDIIRRTFTESFDLLILDWLVPGMSGLEVLLWVRENIDWPIPILFITQRDSETDVVTALERGADDYMAKPIKRLEMLARINVISRRKCPEENSIRMIKFHPYVIDRQHRQVTHEGNHVPLTDKEFDLALFLFRNSGRILSRGHILESVWGRSAAINTRTVDTHISRLRRKLSLSTDSTDWRLIAIYQHGYRLEQVSN